MFKLCSVLFLLSPLFAGSALAALTYDVISATTSDGSPLTAVTPGATITIDILMTTSDFALGLAGSVNDYDGTVVALNTGASFIADRLFVNVCYTPDPTSCFGGLTNGITTFSETFNSVAGGLEAEFFSVVGLTAALGQGDLDPGVSGLQDGGPQMQIVFDVIGAAGSSTTIDIGTFGLYQDAYNGTVDSISNNTSVTVTVPEPAAIATSLAAFTSVFGVIAIRRRML